MMTNYKVKTFFATGSALYQEDAVINIPPFFGVLDGVSGLYDKKNGPRMFGKLSGGKMVAEIITKAVKSASKKEPIKKVALRANTAVAKFAKKYSLDIGRPDTLPGSAFALAKIGEKNIEIVCGGDCFAAWLTTKNQTLGTPNQNYLHDKEQLKILRAMLTKHQGNRDLAWREYLPITSRLRRTRTNIKGAKQYVVINGQKNGPKLWHTLSLPKKSVKLLLLFTDGMMTFESTYNQAIMSGEAIKLYKKGGFKNMIKKVRLVEKILDKKLRHTDHVEAAAIAIEFHNS